MNIALSLNYLRRNGSRKASNIIGIVLHLRRNAKKTGFIEMNNYKYQHNLKLIPMQSLLHRLSASFTYNEVYEIFLAENDIQVLDEILEYFVSIQNYNACAAIKELVKEKCLKN